MQLLTKAQFTQLSQATSEYCLSIYLPTHVAGPEIRQNSIRFLNLLSEAERQLAAAGLEKPEINAMLKQIDVLLDDREFWQHQSHGLALFVTPENAQIHRLPLAFEPLAVVSQRFYLKPLLPLFFENQIFYLLALSQNQVRLFESDRYQIREIPLENVPTSLAEALQYDDPEKQLQYHTGGGDVSAPTYHGQGVGTTQDKASIRRFLTQVNNGLQPYLNQTNTPLVLASVEYLQAIYQDVNTYSHLLADGVAGNPDVAQPDELRAAAWPHIAALLAEHRQQAMAQYQDLQGTGKATDQLEQVILAACRGQVDTLFTKADDYYWGQCEPASGQIEHHESRQPHDDDLLDVAAVRTFLQGGTVYMLDDAMMPSEQPAAAVYRYSIPAEV